MGIMSALSLASLATGVAGTAAAQKQQKQALALQHAQQETQLRQMQKQQEIAERDRRDRLRQVAATQRARAGAQGIDSAGGSSAAILRGLSKRTEQEIDDLRALNDMQLDTLRFQRKRNLLEESGMRRMHNLNMFRTGLNALPQLISLLPRGS